MRKTELCRVPLNPESIDTRTSWNSATLTCPVCGYQFAHIDDVFTRMGTDEGEATRYRGTEVGGTTPSRRSALAISMHCEAGHEFELLLQQHKGNIFLEFLVDKVPATLE